MACCVDLHPIFFELQDAAAGEAVSQAVGTYSHAFSSAVLALLPHAQQPGAPKDHAAAAALAAAALAGSGLAELLLTAHHPAVTAGVACKQRTWQQASRRLLGAAGAALKGTQQHNTTTPSLLRLAHVLCFMQQDRSS
jgi:hypothetical protein